MKKLTIIFMIFSLIPFSWADENQYGFEDYGDPSTEKVLTDEEQRTASEYINQDYINDVMADACEANKSKLKKDSKAAGDDFDPCSDSSDLGHTKFLGMKDSVFETVVQGYALISAAFGAGDGGFGSISMKPKDSKGKTNSGATETSTTTTSNTTDKTKKEKKEKDQKKDYCAMIASASETLAGLNMQTKGNSIVEAPIAPENQQSESFYQLATLQDENKLSSNLRAAAWGATLACYTGYLVAGAYLDTKMIVKIAAASLITWYHLERAKAHKEAAAYLRTIGDKLRNLKGECNPVTEKMCYCAHTTNINDPYCIPTEWKTRTALTQGYLTSCVDANLKEDSNCACAENDSCLSRKVQSIAGVAGFGSTSWASKVNKASSYLDGTLPADADLSASLNDIQASSRRYLNQALKDFKGSKLNLSDKARKNMEAVAKATGLPKVAAAYLAASNPPGLSAMRDKLNANASNQRRYTLGSRSKKNGVSYQSAGRAGSNRRRSKDDSGPDYSSLLKKGKGENAESSVDIEKYAERAEQAAQIEKNPTKVIFDIISYRYRKSAWNRFKVTEN